MRTERDFSKRTLEEQEWAVSEVFCNACITPGLSMQSPREYEEDGRIFVEGNCSRCGSTTEVELHFTGNG